MNTLLEVEPGGRPDAPALVVRHVVKSFGAVQALRGVDLEVGRGECVAVVGDNGAGKSTLVKCVSGVLQPDDGLIEFDGARIDLLSPRHARAVGIETVYQDLALGDELTAVANVFLGRELGWGWPKGLRVPKRREMKQRVKALLHETGVNLPSVDCTVRQLSGGQRQGLAIARAVAWEARLVVLDEPTAALGIRETGNVERIISRLGDRGISVVLVSHNLEQVVRLANRVYVFRHGRVVGSRLVRETSGEEIVGMITGALHQ